MIVAVDLGFGWTKAAAGTNWFVEPSLVGPVTTTFGGLTQEDGIVLWDAGEQYFIGQMAARHSHMPWHSLADNKPGDVNTLRLLKAAVAGVVGAHRGAVGIDVLVTGLPVNLYHDQKTALEQLLLRLHGQPIRAQVGTAHVNMVLSLGTVRVYPQPFGSFLDLVLDAGGELARRDIARGRTLIIDIGFHTVDLLAVEGLTPLARYSRGANLGLAVAYGAVGRRINRPEWEVDLQARRGRIEGMQQSFRDLAGSVSRMVAGLNEPFDLYLVTGGGGKELHPYLDLPGNRILAPDPQLANVRGYLKAGARIRRQGGPR